MQPPAWFIIIITSVSETIRKPSLVKALTALKTKKIKYGKERFSIWRMEFYTLQCGMWVWNRDSEFTKWQHPTMWYVALGWHAIEFAQTSAILEFYIWFRFRPQHRSRYVVLQHQSPKFYPNRTILGRKKMTSCRFSRWRISTILDFRDPIMDALKTQLQLTKLLSFQKIALSGLCPSNPGRYACSV